jgi:hypothetical protein
MKTKIIFLFIFCFVFALNANAQLCGRYTTKLTIKDERGGAIENAEVKLKTSGKDETKGKIFERDADNSSVFSITFFEGHQLGNDYKLTVSAEGYKNFETSIKFPHCIQRNFVIKLAAEKSAAQNFFGQTKTISLGVYDNDEKKVEGVSLTLIGENGEVQQSISGDYGEAKFVISDEGKYTLRAEKGGYKTSEIKLKANEMNFDKYGSQVYLQIDLEKLEP